MIYSAGTFIVCHNVSLVLPWVSWGIEPEIDVFFQKVVVQGNKQCDWEGKIIQVWLIEQAINVVNKFDLVGTLLGAVQTWPRIVPENENGKP